MRKTLPTCLLLVSVFETIGVGVFIFSILIRNQLILQKEEEKLATSQTSRIGGLDLALTTRSHGDMELCDFVYLANFVPT